MKPIQEGSLQSKECESFGATETGALFPRLHVKETKLSGIRAPPRNKMALFEQFTIPPHRFVPPPVHLPSQPCPGVTAFYVTQGSSYDGQYMCNPCYSNQTKPCNSKHQMAVQSIVTQPTVVTSSSSSVVSSSDKEKFEAISGSSVARARASSSAVTSRALPFDRYGNQSVSKNAKDRVPARSQKKDLCHLPLLKTGAGADVRQCDSLMDPQNSQPNIDCLQLSVAPYHKDKSLSLCRNSVEAENTSLGVRPTAVDNFKNGSSHVSDDGKVQDGGSLMFSAKRDVESALESLSIEGQVSIGLPVESCPPKGQTTVDLIGPSEENHLCINENEDGERKNPAASDDLENERFPKQKAEVIVSFSFLSVETSERVANADIGGIKDMANVPNQLENNSCGSHMKPSSKMSGEISESPEAKYCSYPERDSDSISRSSNVMTKLIPKDVIGVIGQREFWKARKQIILQQKTFSSQVFELHRLIKVQQLIATTPGLLIEEDSESALFKSNTYATAPAEVSENLVCNSSAELEEKISQKDKPYNKQPAKRFTKEQTSYPRHTNAHFQQCSVQHQQPAPAAGPYTQFFQCAFGAWGYPVTSQMKNHLQKAVGDKSFVYETLNYSVVNNSVGNETAPATRLSPVPQSIPAHKLVRTEYPLICPDQLTNQAILSKEFSVDKDFQHSSSVKLGSGASGSGVLPQLEWPRPVLRESSLPSKDNPSIKKYQWLDNSPRQTPDTKKQRLEAGEFTQAVCSLEETSLVDFAGSCTLESDRMSLGESNAHQNGVKCANGIFTSTQDYGAPKIGYIDDVEGAFCCKGNFGGVRSSALALFPVLPVVCPAQGSDKPESENLQVSKVIKAVPRSAVAASESTAIILKSIQQERWLQG